MTKELIKDLAEKQAQVEKMGIFLEKMGYSPMASRVYALLLVAEPPYMDFYAIQEFMKASKSSISNALKILQSTGIVDYITFSGDRKRYFRINTKRWFQMIKEREAKGNEMNVMLEEVLAMRKDSKDLAFNEDLQKIVDFQVFMTKGMHNLIEEWETQQA